MSGCAGAGRLAHQHIGAAPHARALHGHKGVERVVLRALGAARLGAVGGLRVWCG